MLTITLYSMPGCSGCRKTAEKFTALGSLFYEGDLTATPDAMEYVTEDLGYSQSPIVTVIYELEGSVNHWSGLNPPKINHVIQLELAA